MSSLRTRLHELLDPADEGDHASRVVDVFLILLILLDVAYFIFQETAPARVPAGLHRMEQGILIVFTVEYALRLWAAGSSPRFDRQGGRLRYAVTPFAVVDLVAIVPILGFVGLPIPHQLTAVRMFRLFKLFRYFDAIGVLGRMIWRVREELAVISVALLMAVLTSGLVMHQLEAEANPEAFGTLGDALWWAIVTMSTVGYGHAVPVTDAGRVVAGFVMVFGIAMFAIPAGLLGASFTREVTVQVERRRARAQKLRRRAELEREEKLIEEVLEARICPHCGKSVVSGVAPAKA